MITHIILSLVLLTLSAVLISIGDSSKSTAPLFFVGGIVGCLFLSHLVMVILIAVAGLL
jgi:hypothetical protein